MLTDHFVETPIGLPLSTGANGVAVLEMVEADEAPISDLPLPGEATNLGLLLLAGLALLSPNKNDESPIEDKAQGFKQDLEYLWSF